MVFLFLLCFVLSTYCVEVDTEKLAHGFEIFKHEIEVLKHEVKVLKQENEQLRTTQEENNHRITALESKKISNAVGFFAHLSSDQEVQPEETIVFSVAEINVGDAYNTNSGEFTCPVSGLYFFSFQIHAGPDRNWTPQIRLRNDDGTNRGFGATFLNNQRTHSAMSTGVAQCAAGEKVYVRNECDTFGIAKSVSTFCGDQEGVWQSYFNGFLIDLL